MEQLIPSDLLNYFLVFQIHFSKPNFIYFQAYLCGLLLTNGRKTMSQIAQCCFWVERSLSSWERFLSENLWDVNAVCQTLVNLLLEQLDSQLMIHGTYLAPLDTVLVAKNGTKMSGVQRWKDHSGNADRRGRITGHHWGILGLISLNPITQEYRCWVTKMRLICGTLNPFQFIVDPAGSTRRGTFWDGVIPLMLELKQNLGERKVTGVADAYFSKVPFIKPLLDNGIYLITRMRKDAVAWDKRIENKGKNTVKMEGEWKLSTLLKELPVQQLLVHIYGKKSLVEAVEREVFIRGFAPKVKVVVAQGKKKPIIFLSTDLSLTATQIIELYSARFSIELAIRDVKQYFGLTHYQCYLGIAIDRFVHLACLAYCVFGLFYRQQTQVDWMPAVSPSLSQWSFARLRQGMKHFAISRILFPKSAPGANLRTLETELDHILRLAA